MPADLHIHTTASDGRLLPKEVLIYAKECGLSYISITDHDTVEGLLSIESLHDFMKRNIIVIPGIEFSTDLPDHEVHILGYYINPFYNDLRNQLTLITADRRDRIVRMVTKLRQLGYAITVEDVMSKAATNAVIGRPYVAKALVEKGYFKTVSEVFRNLLYNNGPAYVPHYKLSPQQTIGLIKNAGGIPVLAHPGLIADDDIVQEMIKLGICGIEVYHPSHNKEQTDKYAKVAARYKLAATGGSDFHGITGRYPEKLGMFTVEDQVAKQLHSYWQVLK